MYHDYQAMRELGKPPEVSIEQERNRLPRKEDDAGILNSVEHVDYTPILL